MAINKTLKGVVRLAGGENYIFTLPDNPSGIQNALANIVVEEVFIECDTTLGGIGITLPQIALFNGGWIPKIFVTSLVSSEVSEITITPYLDEVNDDSINDENNFSFGGDNLGTAYLHIVSRTNWGAWLTEVV
jgi:hypothetical protein